MANKLAGLKPPRVWVDRWGKSFHHRYMSQGEGGEAERGTREGLSSATNEKYNKRRVGLSAGNFTSGKCRKPFSQGVQNKPSTRTGVQLDFVSIASRLRQCGNAKSLSEGRCIHDSIIEIGHGRDRFLGNLLVQMYGKCGSLKDACAVFAMIHERNVFSWTIMIAAYAQNGRGNEALQLFEQMRLEGVIPSKVTFLTILSVCAGQAALVEGKQIQKHVIDSGLESGVVLGTALLNMYAKCGSLEDARTIFDKMIERDVVSWNTMIAAYSQHGRSKEALKFFEQMQHEGVILDKFTFVSVLDACAGQAALAEGKRVHAHSLYLGVESDIDVGNTIINMYGKCGSLVDSRRMFDKMLERNLGSWNAVIASYVQLRQYQEAFQLFQRMQVEGLVPDKFTFVSILSACANQAALDEGKRVHASVVSSHLESEVILGNAIINMYGKCGCLEDARRMFDKMHLRTVASWNAIIMTYANNGQGMEAVQLFHLMQVEGVIPDKVTFVNILDACGSEGCVFNECVSQTVLGEGRQVHGQIKSRGFESDVIVGTALVGMYSKCGSLEDARRIFDKIPKRDVIMWNAMIAAYVQHGHGNDALHLFKQMQLEGLVPDRATLVSALNACTSMTSLDDGKQIHACIVDGGFVLDVALRNALINMYGKCGSVEDAWRIFYGMPERNVVTWTTIIATYARQGWIKEAFRLFLQMQLEGVNPDKVTFVSILDAYSNQAAISEGKWMHALIVERELEEDDVVGTALVHMYAKCGNLADAMKIFDKMHKRDVFSWTVMIAAYGQHGLAQEALQLLHQMQLEGMIPNMLTYVYMLSACSHTGLVNEACNCFVSMCVEYALSPTVEHYNCMIDVLGRAGQLDEAVDLITNMPFEGSRIGWTTLLSACRKHFDVERGMCAAEHIFKLDPENSATYVLLLNLYAAAGRWEARAQIRIDGGQGFVAAA